MASTQTQYRFYERLPSNGMEKHNYDICQLVGYEENSFFSVL